MPDLHPYKDEGSDKQHVRKQHVMQRRVVQFAVGLFIVQRYLEDLARWILSPQTRVKDMNVTEAGSSRPGPSSGQGWLAWNRHGCACTLQLAQQSQLSSLLPG